MPSPTHADECKLACVERAARLASAGDQQRNIDMTMQGASLTQTAGATEDALIALIQENGWSGRSINVSQRLIHHRFAQQTGWASPKCTILN